MTSELSVPPIVNRVSELIGHTPLFELVRTSADSPLLLKLELCNPTGTAKIRMARQMVLDADSAGTCAQAVTSSNPPPANTGLASP
jgi:cystathionine beta-synthase